MSEFSYQGNFYQTLLSSRRLMTSKQRARNRRNLKRVPWLFPTASVRTYARNIVSYIIDPLEAEILKRIEGDYTGYRSRFLRGDASESQRIDSWIDDFEALKVSFSEWLNGMLQSQPVADMMSTVSIGIDSFNQGQFNRGVKEVMKQEYSFGSQWAKKALTVWEKDNLSLIKSLSSQYITQVGTLVSDAVTQGLSVSELRQQIQAATGVTKKKATLLARDQVGKLNGQLSKNRMEEIGIDAYIWSTSMDERVRGRPKPGRYPHARPSHWVMEGALCRWDDPTVFGDVIDGKLKWKPRWGNMPLAHPGMEIQCRCTALPYFDDLIAKADTQLGDIVPEGSVEAKPLSKPTPETVEGSSTDYPELTNDAYKSLNSQYSTGVFSNDELEALEYYKGSGYGSINAALRGTMNADDISSVLKREMKYLEDAFRYGKKPLGQQATLWRGVRLPDEIWDALKVGDQFAMPGYTSVSAVEKVAHRFGTTIYKIKAPSTAEAIRLDRFIGDFESELVFPPNTVLRIDKMIPQKGRFGYRYIEATLVVI